MKSANCELGNNYLFLYTITFAPIKFNTKLQIVLKIQLINNDFVDMGRTFNIMTGQFQPLNKYTCPFIASRQAWQHSDGALKQYNITIYLYIYNRGYQFQFVYLLGGAADGFMGAFNCIFNYFSTTTEPAN